MLNGDFKLNNNGYLKTLLDNNSYENNIQLITRHILKIKTHTQIGYGFCFVHLLYYLLRYLTFCCISSNFDGNIDKIIDVIKELFF